MNNNEFNFLIIAHHNSSIHSHYQQMFWLFHNIHMCVNVK
jgi:hypothetical protein